MRPPPPASSHAVLHLVMGRPQNYSPPRVWSHYVRHAWCLFCSTHASTTAMATTTQELPPGFADPLPADPPSSCSCSPCRCRSTSLNIACRPLAATLLPPPANRYSQDAQREIRDGLRRRVSKALAPLDKARAKSAGKQAARREKATRQAQKRELEATAAKER